MTIEELIGKSADELEALGNLPSEELDKHFGWALEITRPDKVALERAVTSGNNLTLEGKPRKKRKAGVSGTVSSIASMDKILKDAKLREAQDFAVKKAKEMGINLEFPTL